MDRIHRGFLFGCPKDGKTLDEMLPPMVYYRGDPKIRHEERRRKLAEARQRRKEKNLR